MIILGQVPVNVHSDTPVGVWVSLAIAILGALGFRFDAWLKDKKEREAKKDEQEIQRQYRTTDLQRNTEIRDALRQIEIGNTQHHGDILLALATTTCKAECTNFKPLIKPKQKTKKGNK